MTDYAKYNARDLTGFHEYKPLSPIGQVELTALYEMWTKQEQERIIKLLEAAFRKREAEEWPRDQVLVGIGNAIALIKEKAE